MFRYLYTFLTICVLTISTCFAQQELNMIKDSLIWKKRKQVNWNDTSGRVINSYTVNCYVYISLEALANKKVMTSPSRVKVNFEYDRKRDYTIVNELGNNDYLYSQTVQNIYQLYARKLRKECFKINFKPGYYGLLESAFDEYFSLMRSRDNEMRADTENGRNTSKLTEWSVLILRELDAEDANDRTKGNK